MALTESTLASELEALVPTTDAAAAVQTLADAYAAYMDGASSDGVPIQNTATAATAMAGAMSFPTAGTASGAGTALSAGVQAFWAAMVAAPATYFPAATVITPPAALAALAAALTTVFGDNVGSTLEDSAAAMAGVIHTASLGGTATFPGPRVTAIA